VLSTDLVVGVLDIGLDLKKKKICEIYSKIMEVVVARSLP